MSSGETQKFKMKKKTYFNLSWNDLILTLEMQMREGAAVAVRGLGLRSRRPSAHHRYVGICLLKKMTIDSQNINVCVRARARVCVYVCVGLQACVVCASCLRL